METNKSLDHKLVITALLGDVAKQHTNIPAKEFILDAQKVCKRMDMEGMGFLTKTLPSLGKALDRVLASGHTLVCSELGFEPVAEGSCLPILMGGLFKNVLSDDGNVLPSPCVDSVRSLRQVLYCYYKYELPYDPQQERDVIQRFEETEVDIRQHNKNLAAIAKLFDAHERLVERRTLVFSESVKDPLSGGLTPATIKAIKRQEEKYMEAIQGSFSPLALRIVLHARKLLKAVCGSINPLDIMPRHGPGAVSTKERHSKKYVFKQVPGRVTDIWPLDAYFYASVGHVCDEYKSLLTTCDKESAARVILVPKDSRGPRLISCEPLSLQWIQQGIMEVIVKRVERCPLVMGNVSFTDQSRNQRAALFGSRRGEYATLDLKDASDRITCGLVSLLFPEPLRGALMASRSLSTQLPSGISINLEKFAPMGSALCFPVMALSIWAILSAVVDRDVQERILVYGDDVVVPSKYVGHAIERLEAFGLAINHAKSCTSGFFRESCGMDAFLGAPVTPVRFRTVWSSSPCPSSYVSWIAYANSCYKRKYFDTYDYIVGQLCSLYGIIAESPDPDKSPVPALYEVPEQHRPYKTRINKSLQKREYKVRGVRSLTRREELPGWNKLLRYFAETNRKARAVFGKSTNSRSQELGEIVKSPFSASEYTERRTKFVWRWQ